MSESVVNGNHSLSQNITQSSDPDERDLPVSSADINGFNNTPTPRISQSDDDGEHHEGPPLKKRKIVDENHHKPLSRAVSPPWKKITADGPTTFLENGRRRSGRTNIIPLGQQPNSSKRQTRAAYDRLSDKHNRPSYNLNARLKTETSASQNAVTPSNTPRRGPGRPPKSRTEPEKQSSTLSSSPRANRRHSLRVEQQHSPYLVKNGTAKANTVDEELLRPKAKSPSPPLTLQKVRFRVALPQRLILAPANIPAPKKYANFKEFFEKDPLEPFVGQESLSREQIRKEALSRRALYKAQRSRQVIGDNDINTLPEKQLEPRRQFAHHDHLLGHILYFRTLLKQEGKDHRKRAEQLAHEAKRYVEEKRKRVRVKSAEELAREYTEKMRLQYRHVIKDLDKLWLAVQAEVNAIRQRQFEEEQQAKIKSHLNRVLERTDEMLTRRGESEITSDIESGTATPTEDENTESDSEVMSASSSDTDTDDEQEDPDENLTAEQLKAKYEDLAGIEIDAEPETGDVSADQASDDSDPDIEMDSEFDSEVSGESEDENDDDGQADNDDDDDDDEEEEETGDGLLSLLFSRKEVTAMKTESVGEANSISPAEPALDAAETVKSLVNVTLSQESGDGLSPATDIPEVLAMHELAKGDVSPAIIDNEASHGSIQSKPKADQETPLIVEVTDSMEVDEPQRTLSENVGMNSLGPSNLADEIASQDMSFQTSPDTLATRRSEPDSISSLDPHPTQISREITPEVKSNIKTPVPSLLRGTLREYQHEGLDWLANLYANGRSGILADEMGLGKTIQSIALLAHLATQYEVWGPHLIVVPTSVMLNWEMEFKKFLPGFKILTYYGNLEERKQKRRGWMADDSFNVCITSYQLVLQDSNSFKRRRWHYMILDEAHNIKNFRSERWQTMMTFNTRARLLLTGTPLQNNLTELWSLLFFLHYGQEGEDEDEAFAGLKEWSEWFKRPVESILEHGRQVLDQEDMEQVAKLHKVIRPFLLRRLKADVEKQMPAKYEHVEMCRLSKRQRQLYDGFMSRAQTKETLASGNYLSIINALMQLRKVCNHPDLFETRPINTSFAMSKSVAASFEVQDLLFRRKLFSGNPLDEVDLDFLQLVPISNEKISLTEYNETIRRHAYHPLRVLRANQAARINRHAVMSGQKRTDVLSSLENIGRNVRLDDIDRTQYYEAYRHHQRPIYGRGLIRKLDFQTKYDQLSRSLERSNLVKFWESSAPVSSLNLVRSIESRSVEMKSLIQQYACVTPAVVATDLGTTTVTVLGANAIRQELAPRVDPFHQARMKLSIAFPDKRLLQYDCGKLQRLDKLLRNLQSGGHRALIFTQMTKVLDILEQFLNIHGHRYLRLDGATKIEQRQILTDRFNNDNRILCFILSSRSGGLGINLTGADTVIFYDLDWNPAMDRQCTDRAHRIGQTRDVHIYRFVSEHTIESNILRKANQKQLLDDVVIQEGDFTTDYMNKLTYRDMLDDQAEDDVAGLAMDRVLGNDKSAVAAFEQAEDQEDVSAAKVAAKEVQHADDGDFEDKVIATPRTGESGTPGPFGATNVAILEVDADGIHHIDDYLLKLQIFLLRDVPLTIPKHKRKKGQKRGDEHRKRRPR